MQVMLFSDQRIKQSQITTETMEKGVENRGKSYYKNMILKGIQAAGKKPVSWNKKKAINHNQ